MAEQGSAKVSLREIDDSAPRPVNRVLTGTPAGVIGRAKRGPAFVPTVFADIQEFQDIFGSFKDKGLDSNSNLYGPLAVSEWMSGNPGQGAFVRLLGVGNDSNTPGFDVGTKQLGDNGSLISNPFANNGMGNINVLGKTFMLGHFANDNTNVQYLSESGLQPKKFEKTTITVDRTKIVVDDEITVTAAGQGEPTLSFNFNDVINETTINEILIPTQIIANNFNNKKNAITTAISALTTLNTGSIAVLTAALNAIDVNNINLTDSKSAITTISGHLETLQTKISDLITFVGGNVIATSKIIDVQTKYDLALIAFNLLNSSVNSISNQETKATAITNKDAFTTAINNITIALNLVTVELQDSKNLALEIKKAIDLAFPNKVFAGVIDNDIVLTQFVLDVTDSIAVTKILEDVDALTIVVSDNVTDTTVYPLLRGILMTPHNVKVTLRSTEASMTSYGTGTLVTNDGAQIGNLTPDNLGFTLFFLGYNGDTSFIDCSFDSSRSNYFANVLNKDPHKMQEYGHYLYSNYDIDKKIVKADVTGMIANNQPATIDNFGAFCAAAVSGRQFEQYTDRFQTAVSPWIVSQDFGIVADGANNDGMGDGIFKLFRLHALDDGEIGNNQVKIVISNLVKGEFGGFGTFDLSVEKFDANPLRSSVLVAWKRLSLDSESQNYIARVIGDKRIYWDFDARKPGLQEEGSYPVSNKFVRVEVSGEVASHDVPNETLPCGFAGVKSLKLSDKFSDTSILSTNYLANMVEPPVPMIRSIGKIRIDANGNKEAKILPWGIKFAQKNNVDQGADGFREYSEQILNQSIKSYTKYHPSAVWGPVLVDGTTDTLNYSKDPNFFHFEKLYVTCLAGDKLKIDNAKWGDALFIRDGILPVSDSVPATDSGKRRFFRVAKDLSGINSKYLSFTCFMQGGFDGLNIFDKEQHQMTNAACMKEALTAAKTGITAESYKLGIDVYTDKAAAEIQLLAVPGIREPIVTNYAISSAETRFDTLYIMDPELSNENAQIIKDVTEIPSVANTINTFSLRSLDTSFAATYFPDVIFNKPTGGSIKVPASVAVLGVLSRADGGGNTPWYAPAGINRGLLNASAAEFSISREQLDDLYDNDINPIYIPAGRNQVHVFGQKTLLKNPSALDRINVRRLLIYIRRSVKNIANTFLFQPNREDTLRAFSAAVEPILANVQQQQGIERHKVQIDTSTTTQIDVENNTIRGKIYLQPAKSIEFISLDFVVANSID